LQRKFFEWQRAKLFQKFQILNDNVPNFFRNLRFWMTTCQTFSKILHRQCRTWGLNFFQTLHLVLRGHQTIQRRDIKATSGSRTPWWWTLDRTGVGSSRRCHQEKDSPRFASTNWTKRDDRKTM
jgi:hypothetical protein